MNKLTVGSVWQSLDLLPLYVDKDLAHPRQQNHQDKWCTRWPVQGHTHTHTHCGILSVAGFRSATQ